MLNSAQAFDKFLKEFVEPSGKQAEDAIRQEKAVREALQKALGPQEVFISGSYGRGTAIRPLHDIDLFFVLPPDPGPASVQAYLQKFKKAIEDAFPGKQARLQAHSVNIEFTGSEIGFDVLPALKDATRPNVYRIPERDTSQWIQTNPRLHKEKLDEADQRAGSKLRPLIKLAKRWNRQHGKPLPSFHLEVMAWEAFRAPPPSLPEGLPLCFEFLAERVKSLCPDPAGLGSPIDSKLSPERRTDARQKLESAARKARQALEYEKHGNLKEAHPLWRDLLGTDFPER